MAKTIFISASPDQMTTLANHVGYSLSASCDAEAVMGSDPWLHSFSFAQNDTLKTTCGLSDMPVTKDQIKAGLTAEQQTTWQTWHNQCFADVQTWLNTLTNFHIWVHKGDCWSCEMNQTGILNLMDNVDQTYIVTKTGLDWLVETVCRNVLAEDVSGLSSEDMDFLQTYINDNFNGSLASLVTAAKNIESELSDIPTIVSGKSNVTLVSLDDICGNAITSNSNYSAIQTLYNT